MILDTSLRAHTRAVTDLSWHTFDKQILGKIIVFEIFKLNVSDISATSAADTFIYLWDLRDLRRPKQSLQAVAGASKIQWNKVITEYY